MSPTCSLEGDAMSGLLGRTVAATFAAWVASIAVVPAQTAAPAQAWPTRTVRMIIPLGAGGGGDVYLRVLADELQKKFGQPFVVENRPGGGLNIGARACAESVPDGYTLCFMSSEPVVYNQFLFKSLPFNPEKDFTPIASLFANTLALVVNSDLKVKTIPELISYAKTNPGKLSYGTFSFVMAHFMSKMNKQHGIDIIRVPFRGGGEVVNAVLAGTSPVAFLALSNMIPQVQNGQITALAVNAEARTPLFPNVPTLMQAYGEDYPPTWFGLFAPAGTPQAIIDKVHAEVVRITGEPAFQQKWYTDRAVEYTVGTPEEFAKAIVKNRAFAEQVAKESGQEKQ
jgi:tripartite-type tricarboxylate transporter receptor subunit TctC